MCTLQELSEATAVSVKQIRAFIRDGRISITDSPNMSYECDLCGVPIREYNVCESCSQRLKKDLMDGQEDAKRREQLEKQENQMSYRIGSRLTDRLDGGRRDK